MSLGSLFTEGLVRPLFNLLVGITNVWPTHSVGVSIIILTIIVRLLLLPPAVHQARQMQGNQERMHKVKQEIAKIKQRFQHDQAKQAQETMRLYREAGLNPARGCLPLVLQLPILIALYRVFLLGIGPETVHLLYPFVGQPLTAQLVFFGINLANSSPILAILAGISQLVLMKMSTPPTGASATQDEQAAQMVAAMQKNMLYVFPIMTVVISLQLPAALALYWTVSTVFGIGQQYAFKRYLNITSLAAT